MDSNRNGVKSDDNIVDEESDGDDESQSLLKKGCLSKNSEKPRRKVHWLDDNGDNKLAEILEFQPSDVSDSDDDDSDSCICRIMKASCCDSNPIDFFPQLMLCLKSRILASNRK